MSDTTVSSLSAYRSSEHLLKIKQSINDLVLGTIIIRILSSIFDLSRTEKVRMKQKKIMSNENYLKAENFY